MAKIDLTVAGDISDVIDIIRRLAAGNGSSPAAASNNPGGDPDGHPSVDPPAQPPAGGAATVAQDPWTMELARALWVLLSPDVQQIYRRVAHGNDHTLARDFLLDAMGLTVRALSGRLSSQGHALRRIRPLRRSPAPSQVLRPAHRAIPNASQPRGRHRGAEPLTGRRRY